MKFILMLLFCPHFLRDMPKPMKGQFVAKAYTVSPFRSNCIRFNQSYNCRRKAYLVARWEALKLDWTITNPEIGIGWAVKVQTQ
jgi:hypothetical protein